MAKAAKRGDDLHAWVERANVVIRGLAQKLKRTEDENAKLKGANEKAKSTLKSAVEAGEKLLMIVLFVGTIALALYYIPKGTPKEEVAATPPTHFLQSSVA